MKKWLFLLAVLLMAAIVWMMLHGGKGGNSSPLAVAALPAPAPAPLPPPPAPIVRIHFAGAAFISKDTNSLAFENEFCSTQAVALENQTLDKLSRAPARWFKAKLPSGAGNGTNELRPLLNDFLKSEWLFQMADAPASPEYMLAIRLDDARARLWQDNLRKLLESWTKITAQPLSNGWQLKKDLPPNLIRCVRSGDWVVIGCGQDHLSLTDQWLQDGAPTQTNWLNADVNWPRLAKALPAFAKFDLPAIQVQVIGKNGNFEINGKLDLSQPLPALEKWQIPTNIYQPLTSFTAVRGFGPWLQQQSWAKALDISPEPNQLFCWSLGLMPLQTFISVPVPDARQALAQLGQNLSADKVWQSKLIGPFSMAVLTNRIFLKGVPFIGPEIQALHESSGDFLFADVFPNPLTGKTGPTELFRQLDQDHLVYYGWEITPLRLKALPQLTQLGLLLTHHRQLQSKSAAGNWLKLIGPKLGQARTEAVQSSPAEISFYREAPGGLTAAELIALANWLEAANFPGCDLTLPPQPVMPMMPVQRPIKTLSIPATPPPRH